MAGRLQRAIDGFFFGERPIHPMVICRVVFGLCLITAYATRGPELQFLYGPAGISGADLHARAPEGWPQHFMTRGIFQWLHLSDSEALVWLLWGALLVGAAGFTLGFMTRTSGLIALFCHAVLHAHNPILLHGWGYLIKPYMAYVILSRAGVYASVDAWLRRRRGQPGPASSLAPAWPLRLLQIHVCTMYAVAGWSRLVEPAWLGGHMLLAMLNWQWFSRFPLDWNAYREILRPLSMGALVLEPLAPLLLWVPRVGTWWALGLIAMHVVLELLVDVGMWQFMMLAALTTFLPLRWLGWAVRQPPPGRPAPP